MTAPFDYRGRVAVVTGGTAGIGNAIAAALHTAGASVVLLARDEARGNAAAERLSRNGGRAMFVPCDATDERAVDTAFAAAGERYGEIDIVVANVGASIARAPLVDLELDVWEAVLRTNLTATFLCFRAGARAMIRQGTGGALVAISSAAAVQASPRASHYAAAKSGLGGLVRSVAHELAPHRIRCNALMPGFTAVERMNVGELPDDRAAQINAAIPAGRWATPEEVAQGAMFLCDPTLSYHTGVELRADGGLSTMASHEATAAAWTAAEEYFRRAD